MEVLRPLSPLSALSILSTYQSKQQGKNSVGEGYCPLSRAYHPGPPTARTTHGNSFGTEITTSEKPHGQGIHLGIDNPRKHEMRRQ